MAKFWTIFGALSGFVSVAMGAFGAHALAEKLDEKMLAAFKTGAQYQMYHSLALIAVGLWARSHPGNSTSIVGWSFVFGTILFSGSLYAMALTDIKVLGAITPLGGLSFMVGWIAFAVAVWRASY